MWEMVILEAILMHGMPTGFIVLLVYTLSLDRKENPKRFWIFAVLSGLALAIVLTFHPAFML